MKKMSFLLIVAGIMMLASCTFATKNCRCYEYLGSRWTGPHIATTAEGTPCNRLNSTTYQCNEMLDPIIDPNDIAEDFK